ncbi:MAG: hypothetical protein HQK73_10855 [Desulfamplus sp.]|nr:hypothetical protein [Desulfamplus sp.]
MVEILVGLFVLWLLSSKKEDSKHDGYFFINDPRHKDHDVSAKHHYDNDDNHDDDGNDDWDGDG